MELGDDATYPMKGFYSLSFWMPLGNILELNDILFVFGVTKNLLLVRCMIDLHCVTKYEAQKVIQLFESTTQL